MLLRKLTCVLRDWITCSLRTRAHVYVWVRLYACVIVTAVIDLTQRTGADPSLGGLWRHHVSFGDAPRPAAADPLLLSMQPYRSHSASNSSPQLYARCSQSPRYARPQTAAAVKSLFHAYADAPPLHYVRAT